jgi:hypothetical protein
MRVAWASWVQGLLGLAKAALFITVAVVIKRGATESVPTPPPNICP